MRETSHSYRKPWRLLPILFGLALVSSGCGGGAKHSSGGEQKPRKGKFGDGAFEGNLAEAPEQYQPPPVLPKPGEGVSIDG